MCMHITEPCGGRMRVFLALSVMGLVGCGDMNASVGEMGRLFYTLHTDYITTEVTLAGSTLVAGQNEGKRQAPVGQPVPILIMTPDNKRFPPIEIPIINIIRVGRFVDKAPTSEDMITFKSKVISRNHAEIWSVNGEVYIRDTKSQSGTFLNAMRLSEPSKESKPYRLKPGDMIQFGVDYKNATEGSVCLLHESSCFL